MVGLRYINLYGIDELSSSEGEPKVDENSCTKNDDDYGSWCTDLFGEELPRFSWYNSNTKSLCSRKPFSSFSKLSINNNNYIHNKFAFDIGFKMILPKYSSINE
jgi:hypothetical protein